MIIATPQLEKFVFSHKWDIYTCYILKWEFQTKRADVFLRDGRSEGQFQQCETRGRLKGDCTSLAITVMLNAAIVRVCKSYGATRPCNTHFPASSSGLDFAVPHWSDALLQLLFPRFPPSGKCFMCHLAFAQKRIIVPFSELLEVNPLPTVFELSPLVTERQTSKGKKSYSDKQPFANVKCSKTNLEHVAQPNTFKPKKAELIKQSTHRILESIQIWYLM